MAIELKSNRSPLVPSVPRGTDITDPAKMTMFYKNLLQVFKETRETTYDDFNTLKDVIEALQTSAPVTSASTGVAGQWAYDSSYLYICIATNTWKRVAISTW